uniref:Uncharacterized protein AlNc14C19G1985 n=1 Tax=Albugo laibachii Nc14 TaxID=890382 RepID=F0W514_9STRA|nr:conserved hypothetical protein [Albugo laibachii Nc14]|eukprot:CCA16205.1 conserved hypothetical protein [Albugo laibachii Nc14]
MTHENDTNIHLSQKQAPLCELDTLIANTFPLVTRRCGPIDISLLQRKINLLNAEMWTAEYQSSNVSIVRAAHDKWGIDKAVFIFCDDYLKRVYLFPWLHTWNSELNAILSQIGITWNRVVRCILARIPPNTSIPIHHDTGYWVSQTHRIHIPICTNHKVEFRVGVNSNGMNVMEFKQAHVYELNNACKHAVQNRSTQARIHLILDYVEDHYPPLSFFSLTNDMTLHQTRRSLDPSSMYDTRKVPSFIVMGSLESDVLELYDFITSHDLIIPAKTPATHFFDEQWNTHDLMDPEWLKAQGKRYASFFEEKLLMKCPSIMTGEATWGYYSGGAPVIQRIQSISPDCKVIVVLREPLDRLACVQGSIGHTLKTLEDELNALKQANVHPKMEYTSFQQLLRGIQTHDSLLATSLYALPLKQWLAAYTEKNCLVLCSNDLKSDGKRKVDIHSCILII